MGNVSQLFGKKSKKQQYEANAQEVACLWISRMDRGLSPSEKEELTIWCNENKQHHDSLLEMASYWDDFSILNELSDLFPLAQPKSLQRSKLYPFALAAGIAMISLIGVNTLVDESFLPYVPSFTEHTLSQNITLEAEIGEQTSFTLKDGSQIKLNTNSLVTVEYTPTQRKLTLVRGEARFDVAKDKDRPFTVTVGFQSFTALGTIFNVQKNNNQVMELVVTEGKVLITKATASVNELKATLTHANNSFDSLESTTQHTSTKNEMLATLVVSGEKAVIAKNTNLTNSSPVKKLTLDQIHRDLAWQQGMLIFKGEPLSQALEEVSRYTTSNFKIVDSELAKINVAGYFKADDIEGLLSSLQSNFGIDYHKSIDGTILLTSIK